MQLVTLGGAALRLTPPGTQRLETARTLDVGVTGSECNAAVTAQRLGANATWLSRLPDTPLGRRVANELRGHDLNVVAEYVDGRQGMTFFERGSPPRENAYVDDLSGAAVESLSMDALPTERVEAADTAYVTAATPRTSTGLAGATAKFLKTASESDATTALGMLDTRGWVAYDEARDTLEGLFPAVDVFVGAEAAVEAVLGRDGELGPVMHALASEYGFETVALLGEHAAAAWYDSTVHEFARPDVETVDVTGAADAFAGAFHACDNREHHFAAIAEGLQAEQLESVRHRPAQIRFRQIFRTAPIHLRRVARFARRAPVDLPPGFKLEVQAQAQGFPLAYAAGRRDQAHAPVLVRRPVAGRGAIARRCLGRRQCNQG
jgi:2-dehydro-3-deoxygluconokinase